MTSWFASHVGWCLFTDSGIQMNLSWGLVFGIPFTLAVLWLAYKIGHFMPKWHHKTA